MSWRFNPPPGWPTPPEDWVPPPGWAPDSSWPPAPPDWNFWVPATAPPAESGASAGAAAELPTAPVQPVPGQPAQPAPGQPAPVPAPGGLTAAPSPPAGHYPPPPGYPPVSAPGRGKAWAIGGGLAALLLVLCTGGVVTVAVNWDRLAGDDPEPGGDPVEASVGWEDCAAQPDVCNSGEREPGGRMVWTIDNLPGAYFPWTVEGGTTATLQAIHGILPHFGQFLPSGEYAYNFDLLTQEPELVSEDPMQVVWRINPDAVWDDGTPISADDVIVTWKMNTTEDAGHCTGCESRGPDDQIESIEGSDGGKTVTITYQPDVSNPEWFAEFSAHSVVGGIVPAHVAERNGWNPDDPADLGAYFQFLNESPPSFSGGPYLIESFVLDQQVVKVPNPNWYGEVQPTLDELVIRFGTDPLSWVPALQAGDLDGGSPSGWSEDVIRQVQDLDDVLLHIQPGPVWDHLDVNLDNEWLGDVELRRAIFTAIDNQEIAERNFGALFPDYTLRTNHIHGEASEFHVDQLAGTGQGSGDLALAREILATAGYEGYDGGPGALTLDDEPVAPLRLRSTNSPQRMAALELIQTQLAELGIDAQIEPGEDLGSMLIERDFDLVLFGWSGSPLFTSGGAQYWATDSGSNFGGYSNPEVDDLIALARQATSLDESAALHDQMMEVVVADAYILPLYDTPIYAFVSDEFINVRDNPNSSLRALYQHHEWGLAAK